MSVAPRVPSDEPLPTLAAAICTRERPEQLRRALASLVAQASPADEIVVVDNAPRSDENRRTVEDEFPDVVYVLEPRPGLDPARNRALATAKSVVVAFLDDDAVADRNWAAAIRDVFASDERVGVCTGRVEALSLETEGQKIFESNGGFSRGHERIRLPRDSSRRLNGVRVPLIAWAVSVGSGCSFAVRRHAALALGGFDDALDRGKELPGGGDHDMLWRLLESGYDSVYEPTALAWHEHRADASGAYEQIVGHQLALVAFLTKSLGRARGWSRVSLFGFLLWRLQKPPLRVVSRLLGGDPLPVGVLLRMWSSCWRGLLAYGASRRSLRRDAHGAA